MTVHVREFSAGQLAHRSGVAVSALHLASPNDALGDHTAGTQHIFEQMADEST